MNPVTWITNLTSEDVQRYTRVAIQYGVGALVSYGLVTPDATWIPVVTGLLVGLVTLAWTIYGNRLKAKMVEVEKAGATVVTTTEMAAATPNSPNILSKDQVEVVPK